MDMFNRLEDIVNRYEDITAELSNPDVVNDQNKFRSLMKEQNNILPIVTAFNEYKSCKQNIDDSLAMLNEESDEELLEMARWGEFDVLGHLTYPLRYIVGDSGLYIDMSKYLPIIKEIFSTLIKNDIGIEINSSGLRQKIGLTLPDKYYVRLYKELGGTILTVGSDAHRTEDLGKGIPEAIALARNVGFTELAFFKKRNPTFISII